MRPHEFWAICKEMRLALKDTPVNELLPVEGGTVQLARPQDSPFYGQFALSLASSSYCHPTGWDNEFGDHAVKVEGFSASKFLVSNGEFLEFMRDGGYQRRELWTDDGWQFVQYKKAKHPVFWVPIPDSEDAAEAEAAAVFDKEEKGKSNSSSTSAETATATYEKPRLPKFRYRCMLQEIDMPYDWPVDVNYMEAKAWCNWKALKTGKQIRLPTEEEWVLLRDTVYPDGPKASPGFTSH